ncbi:hypothetical protein VKT23_016111 [Stygiomarasmius scandens]|uniref:Heterokaryon incompatibility domain-containing protein n=1 Tax=Marasmiellus scandens TaxID=2682957 RepID=A0ABR1IXD2_9AGAR
MMDTNHSPKSKSTIRLPHSATQLPKRSFISRLFEEYPGVRGCGWFAHHAEQRFHVFGNAARVLSHIIFAPVILAFPVLLFIAILYLRLSANDLGWYDDGKSNNDDDEEKKETVGLYDIPIAVLRHPPGHRTSTERIPLATYGTGLNSFNIYPSSSDVYAATNFKPRWMLEVQICDGKYVDSKQVNWEGDLCDRGYTTISYGIKSAQILFEKAGKRTQDPRPEGKDYTLADRKRIAKQLLEEYCSAQRVCSEGEEVFPNRTEYIWLDEFCISDVKDEYEGYSVEVSRQRKEELGRIPDIFKGAETVVVFCHKPKCQHITLDCPWGKRLFTLGEILHAKNVERMTRMTDDDHHCLLYSESAQSFHERMMHYAAEAGKWHLHSLLWSSINSGCETWQSIIHALMVEAIRRDVQTGFSHHELLGQGLNGLLPRRACLHHLQGKDGWVDLAWLLELNQGFYNVAALAAVCCLNNDPNSGYGWLGPPIEPKAGNERLEPLVHAFPAGRKDQLGNYAAHLIIVGAETITIEPCIKRNSEALYLIPAFRWKKIVSMTLLAVCWMIGIILISLAGVSTASHSSSSATNSVNSTFNIAHLASSSSSSSPLPPESVATKVRIGVLMIYLSSITFSLFRLAVSLRYVERSGWVFLSDNKMNDGSEGDFAWGSRPETVLQQLDSSLGKLAEWGDQQMAPKWNVSGPQFKVGHLVDLRSRVKVQVTVTKKPNSMVVLGIHGNGVTCMLLNRPNGANEVAEKVGMVNLPPYVLAQTERSGSLRVGVPERRKTTCTQQFLRLFWQNRTNREL